MLPWQFLSRLSLFFVVVVFVVVVFCLSCWCINLELLLTGMVLKLWNSSWHKLFVF